ncbi:MAG: hypothetical protein ACTHNY_00745 [Solirubrobacterales bacterium]
MAPLGLTVRVPVFWFEVEPQRGRYDFDQLDATIAMAAARGIRVLPFLYGSPSWVADQAAVPPLAGAASRAWRASSRIWFAATGPTGPSGAVVPTAGRSTAGRSGTSRTSRSSGGRDPRRPSTCACSAPRRRRSGASIQPLRSSPPAWPRSRTGCGRGPSSGGCTRCPGRRGRSTSRRCTLMRPRLARSSTSSGTSARRWSAAAMVRSRC